MFHLPRYNLIHMCLRINISRLNLYVTGVMTYFKEFWKYDYITGLLLMILPNFNELK